MRPRHGWGPCLPVGPAVDLADGRTQLLTSSPVQGAEVSADRWQAGGRKGWSRGGPVRSGGPGGLQQGTAHLPCLPGARGVPSLSADLGMHLAPGWASLSSLEDG